MRRGKPRGVVAPGAQAWGFFTLTVSLAPHLLHSKVYTMLSSVSVILVGLTIFPQTRHWKVGAASAVAGCWRMNFMFFPLSLPAGQGKEQGCP